MEKRRNTILHIASYKPPSNNADSTSNNQNRQQQENQRDQQVIKTHSSIISKHLFLQILTVILKHSKTTTTGNTLPDQTPPTYLKTLPSILVFKVKKDRLK